MSIDPASYRDPAGQVHRIGDKIYRTVQPVGLEDYIFVRDSGALLPLIADGSVVAAEEVESAVLGEHAPQGGIVVEHPKIPFISYPYEWSFGALKAAALLHLDIQITLLDQGITLSDASAYNIQFQGPKPVFIDLLSFRKYRENEHWSGHRQFCEQFLNPLLLRAYLDIPFNDWYRGRLEGIPAGDLSRLVKLRHRFSWRVLSHVILPARLQSAANEQSQNAAIRAKTRGLPQRSYMAILVQLRNWIAGLTPKGKNNTVWANYASDNTYIEAESRAKQEFVSDFAGKVRPALALDVGCNTGDYSKIALSSGATAVVGLDADYGALEQAYARAQAEKLNFLPLYQDSANASPGQGWKHIERQSLEQRTDGIDAVLALAFEHHLAIGRNIPLPGVVQWITSLAPRGVVEFVPKEDPTVQKMLALRDDIFPDYSVDTFIHLLEQQARIVKSQEISASGRRMFWFDRTE